MLKDLERTKEKAKSAAVEGGGRHRTVKESDEWVSLIYLKDKLSRERKQDTRIFREIQELVEVFGGSLFYLNPAAIENTTAGSTQKKPVLLLQSGWNKNSDKLASTLTRPDFLEKRGELSNPSHYSIAHTDATVGGLQRFDLGSEIRVSSKSTRKRQKAGYDQDFIARYGISKTINKLTVPGDWQAQTDGKNPRTNRSSKSHRLDSKSPSTKRNDSKKKQSRSRSAVSSRNRTRDYSKMKPKHPALASSGAKQLRSDQKNKKKPKKPAKSSNKHKVGRTVETSVDKNRRTAPRSDDSESDDSHRRRTPRPYKEVPVADFNVQDEERKQQMVEYTREKKKFEEDLQTMLKAPSESSFHIVGQNVRNEKDQVQVATEVSKILTSHSNLKPARGPGKVSKANVAMANKSTQTDTVYEELVQFPIVKYPRGHEPANRAHDKESVNSGSSTLHSWPKPSAAQSVRTAEPQRPARFGGHPQIEEQAEEEDSEADSKRGQPKSKRGKSRASKKSSQGRKGKKAARQKGREEFLSDPSDAEDFSSDPLEVDHLSEIEEHSENTNIVPGGEQYDRLLGRNGSKHLDNSFNDRLDESQPVLLEMLEERGPEQKKPAQQPFPAKRDPPPNPPKPKSETPKEKIKTQTKEAPQTPNLKEADKKPNQNNTQLTPQQSPGIRNRQESKTSSKKAGSISSRVVEKKIEDGAEIVEHRPEVSLIEDTGDPDFKPEEHFKNEDSKEANNQENNSFLMDDPEEPKASNGQTQDLSKAPDAVHNQAGPAPLTTAPRPDNQQPAEATNPEAANKNDPQKQLNEAKNPQASSNIQSNSLPPQQPPNTEPNAQNQSTSEGAKQSRTFGKSPFASQNKEPEPASDPLRKEPSPLKGNPFVKKQAESKPVEGAKPPLKENPFVKKDGAQPATQPKPQATAEPPKPRENPFVKKLEPPKQTEDPKPAPAEKVEASVSNLKSLWK